MDDEQEATSWDHRKSAVREKFYQHLNLTPPTGDPLDSILDESTMPPPSGDAPPAPATEGASSVMADAPPSDSSGTSATVTAPPATPRSRPSSSTPVESTKSSFDVSTEWTTPLNGWLEHSSRTSIVGPNGSLLPGLSPKALASLQALATGNGAPEHEIVHQIAEFFAEEEDPRAEGPLIEAIEWYLENYVVTT